MCWKEKIQWQSVTNGLQKEHVLRSPFLFLQVYCHKNTCKNNQFPDVFWIPLPSIYRNVLQTEFHHAPTTLKSEGEVTSLSGVDKREARDNREKWWEYREKSKYFSNCTTFHIRGALSWHSYVIMYLLCIKVYSVVV